MLAVLPGVAERRQGVRRLARLGDDQHHPALRQRRLAITEFGRDVDLDRHPGDLLQPVFGDQPGVIGRAAGGDGEARYRREVEGQVRQVDLVGGRIEKAVQGVADDHRLLVDLLEHEMAVFALADGGARGRRLDDRAVDRLVVGVVDLGAVALEDDPVALLQIADALGQRCQRQGVGAEIHLPVAKADRQRAPASRADHQVFMGSEDDGEGESAVQALQGLRRRVLRGEALVHVMGDQMGDDLGIRVAVEPVARRLQFVLQFLEILDDAVMDQGHPLGRMGMGVDLVRHPMGRPAGVTDPGRALDRADGELVDQPVELALRPAALDETLVEGRHPRAVITAIFEALQPVDQQGNDGRLADDADDAAHVSLLLR